MKQLTHERARELLDYDPATGTFRWRVDRSGKARAGTIAGTPVGNGAVHVGIDCKVYLAHRLAWFWVHGKWPESGLDHINGDRADNSLANLRPATQMQNSGNRCLDRRNTSGHRGVSWHKGKQKWLAQITYAGRAKYVGLYDTPDEAAAAFAETGREMFGEFFNARSDDRDLPDSNGMITFPVRISASQEKFLWEYSVRHAMGGRMAVVRALIARAMKEDEQEGAEAASDAAVEPVTQGSGSSRNMYVRMDDELQNAIDDIRRTAHPLLSSSRTVRKAIFNERDRVMLKQSGS